MGQNLLVGALGGLKRQELRMLEAPLHNGFVQKTVRRTELTKLATVAQLRAPLLDVLLLLRVEGPIEEVRTNERDPVAFDLGKV